MAWRITIFMINLFASLFVMTGLKAENFESQVTFDKKEDNVTSVLSRRKRYLIFPEGSSFQLVYCVQTIALIPIPGQIFLYGNTASLAWELPSDPEFFRMSTKDKAQKRTDTRFDFQERQRRKPFINPAFSKRNAQEQNVTFKERVKIKMDRIKMHERHVDREYLNRKHMNERSVEFHRRSRVAIYEKIEKLINAVGTDGRHCVLRKLCESARSGLQGTFQQELLRVLFTLHKGKKFEEDGQREYDEAHDGSIEDCRSMYPECEIEMSI